LANASQSRKEIAVGCGKDVRPDPGDELFDRSGGARPSRPHTGERISDRGRVLLDPLRLFFPQTSDLPEHPTEPGSPVTVGRREVRAAEEHLPGGGEEAGEWPTSLARKGADLALVSPVDLGVLIAVHLDRDEIFEEQPGDLGVRVRALVHHVAPVAPGGPDVQQYRATGAPRELERLRPPRMPLDRLFGRAAEIRRGRLGEAPTPRPLLGVRHVPTTICDSYPCRDPGVLPTHRS
jgi:hypothetical protein